METTQKSIEKRLTITYTLCVVFGAIASITTGIAWGHWYKTLDQCVGRNCSCILYGKHTPSHFLGKIFNITFTLSIVYIKIYWNIFILQVVTLLHVFG